MEGTQEAARTDEARVVDIAGRGSEGVLQLLGIAHAAHLGVVVRVPAEAPQHSNVEFRTTSTSHSEQQQCAENR